MSALFFHIHVVHFPVITVLGCFLFRVIDWVEVCKISWCLKISYFVKRCSEVMAISSEVYRWNTSIPIFLCLLINWGVWDHEYWFISPVLTENVWAPWNCLPACIKLRMIQLCILRLNTIQRMFNEKHLFLIQKMFSCTLLMNSLVMEETDGIHPLRNRWHSLIYCS